MKVDLASEGQQGLVWMCGACDDVHVRWQNITVTLTRAQFELFSRMAAKAGAKLASGKGVPFPAEESGAGESLWLH